MIMPTRPKKGKHLLQILMKRSQRHAGCIGENLTRVSEIHTWLIGEDQTRSTSIDLILSNYSNRDG